jgi:hypothetical protein
MKNNQKDKIKRGRQSERSQIKQKKVTMKFLELEQMLRRLKLRRHTKD